MSHANARFTPAGRLLIVQRVEAGMPQAHVADQIRQRFVAPDESLRELYSRITFNVLVGNTDDHAKNHAAFWDGSTLQLTPAYDICPQLRSGNEAQQAMAYGSNGDRGSQVARCAQHAAVYHLDRNEAAEIVDSQIPVIRDNWREVCDLAQAAEADRDRLRGRLPPPEPGDRARRLQSDALSNRAS